MATTSRTACVYELRFALEAIASYADNHAKWVKVFLAMLSLRGTEWEAQARELIETWSQTHSSKWCEKEDDSAKWDRESGSRDITYVSIFAWADEEQDSREWRAKAANAWHELENAKAAKEGKRKMGEAAAKLIARIEQVKVACESSGDLAATVISEMAHCELGNVEQEEIFKAIKAATGIALKPLREDYRRARRQAKHDGSKYVVDANLPVPTARTLIQKRFTVDYEQAIRHWQDEFYVWNGVRYETVSNADIRAQVYELYEDHEVELPNRSPVDNTVDALKAQANVLSTQEMPGWLGSNPPAPVRDLIAMSNGLLHTSTGQLHPNDPRFFSAGSVDVSYSPNAPKPEQWLKFLSEVFPGDQESIDALQQWFGYLLTQDTTQQKGLICVGPKRSGKGTIARVLRALLGEHNCTGPTLNQLAASFGLQGLINKLVAIISDARVSGNTDLQAVSEHLLRITGEDGVRVPRKNMSDWEGHLVVRFVLLTNILPGIVDAGGAIASRFIVLRFTRSFFGKEDPKLTDKLMAELPGILNWALDGLRSLQGRGAFLQPASGLQAVEELKRRTTPIVGFISDVLEPAPDAWVHKDTLYEAYRHWCNEEGMKFINQKNSFFSELYANNEVPMEAYQPRVKGKPVKAVRGARLALEWTAKFTEFGQQQGVVGGAGGE